MQRRQLRPPGRGMDFLQGSARPHESTDRALQKGSFCIKRSTPRLLIPLENVNKAKWYDHGHLTD